MKSAFVLYHVGFESLDAFGPVLVGADYTITYVDAVLGDLSVVSDADLLVVLGGPIGAYEEDIYPFLATELALIERRLASSRPMMGICLGAQLIARAAGARVYPSGHKEIGFGPISLTHDGAKSCLAPFAADPVTLHWHGDTFDLPDGAVRLASTDLCENQAFAIGPKVIGFQFHPESSGQNIEHWLVGHAAELAQAECDILQIRRDAESHAPQLRRKAELVMSKWLDDLP